MNILDNKAIILATLLGWLLLIDDANNREELGEKNSVLWYEVIWFSDGKFGKLRFFFFLSWELLRELERPLDNTEKSKANLLLWAYAGEHKPGSHSPF